GKVRVEDAHGAPPNIPFWRGEAPSRTVELSAEVARLRDDIDHLLEATPLPLTPYASPIQWLRQECGLDQRGAQQAVEYVLECKPRVGLAAFLPWQEGSPADSTDEGGGSAGRRLPRCDGLSGQYCRRTDSPDPGSSARERDLAGLFHRGDGSRRVDRAPQAD